MRPICGGHRNVNQHENYLCVYLLGEILAFFLVRLSVTDCGLNFNPPANLKSFVFLKLWKSTLYRCYRSGLANFLDGQHGAVLRSLSGDGAGLDASEGLVAIHLLSHNLGAGDGVGLALLHQYIVAGLDGDLLGLVHVDGPALLPGLRHSVALLDITRRGGDGDLNWNLWIKR